MARCFNTNKKLLYSSDYTNKLNSIITVCNIPSSCKTAVRTNSYEQLYLYNNGILGDCINNKTQLSAGLTSREDLEYVTTLCDRTNECCSNSTDNCSIDKTTFITTNLPLYSYYKIDPRGVLFGNSPCGILNYTKYMVPKIQIPFKIKSGNYKITSDSNYNTIINFYSDSIIEILNSIQIDYTIVGGGGGGGGGNIGGSPGAGGGGGGGVKAGTFISNSREYIITVGLGGQGGLLQTSTPSTDGLNGFSSLISGIDIVNGGYGGKAASNNGTGGNSGNGGTGGTGNTSPGGNGINGGGGGGGAYGPPTQIGGNGAISLTSVYNYGTAFGAGGGGGGGNNLSGIGGNIYAGNGGLSNKNAIPNYSGGGGGSTSGNGIPGTYSNGGNGGSGIVIFYFNI